MNVLISAYACEPEKGSEPGVGWHTAVHVARRHSLWVVTRSNNRSVIEQAIPSAVRTSLNFVYHDLPKWLCWWKRGGRGVALYYWLWQLSAWFVYRRVVREHSIDVVHHLTFGKYWVVSMLAFLNRPFVWGVVGGGESMPSVFLRGAPFRAKVFECCRRWARALGERDPLVRLTARRASLALAATEETARRLKKLGSRHVKVMPQCALTTEQSQQLGALSWPDAEPFRFISMGRPLYWKGFHLGLEAFGRANIPNSEYWVLANGPERAYLEQVARHSPCAARIRFIDRQPSLQDVYALLAQCHVLVHPALHEAFGNVVLEAMAAGRPVLCLDRGGPALQVTGSTGYAVSSDTPEQAVMELSQRMQELATDPVRAKSMGDAARQRAITNLGWDQQSQAWCAIYEKVMGTDHACTVG